jgi:DNA-binding response OmpR family regulator
MDGWSVLSALKADAATADIPVIMMTIVDDKQMGFALGAADYFTKPIDFQRLHRFEKYPTHSTQTVIVSKTTLPREMLRRTGRTAGRWPKPPMANGLEQLGHFRP